MFKSSAEYLGIVDGEPKFVETELGKENLGMDLRDYFAAKAMQAFIVKGITPAEGLNRKQAIVSMAYETADAMMKVREE